MSDKSQTLSNLNNDVNYDYNFGNYNPNDVEVAETINAVFVVDTSSSVLSYGAELNKALNEFTQRMQKSHAAQNLFVSHIEFNDNVNVISGFRPIADIQTIDLVPRIGGCTALYKACAVGLKNALDYRKDLENAGVNCKTLLFVITDGEDNASGAVKASDVKAMIDDLLKEERNFFSFESILFGVGNDKSFEDAQKDMGIKHLAKVGTTADEIRKMINFISSSITSVSTGQGFSAPNF
jgi:uncharacterized protein YegL